MKKLITKLVLYSIAFLICTSGLVWSVSYLCGNGKDLTEEYNAYKAIKDITVTEELTETVSAMQVSYHIKNQKMTFDKYHSFSFNINGDTCTIKGDEIMAAFEKIDQGTDEKLDIKKTYGKDSTETYIQYRDRLDNYKKINDNYFCKHEYFAFYVASFGAATFSFIMNLFSTIIKLVEKKDNLKYKKITVINTTEN